MASNDSTALAIPGQVQVLSPAEQNAANMAKLEQQVTELLVSSYDPVVGKTIWQCAQCHFSSKFRYTVKEHIETHLSGFTHQCPHCVKTCKTRNALRAHVMRAHSVRPPQPMHQRQVGQQPQQPQQPQPQQVRQSPQQQPPPPQQQQQQQQQQTNWQMQQNPISPDGVMQIQLQEMPSPEMKAPRRPRQKRPYDEELERQIRVLLISSYDPVEVKTTWHCSQCGFSSKLQYTVKQHIETHITTIVHQCALCPKILKTRNALRAHMNQKHESKPRQSLVESPPWMGGGGGGGTQSNNFSPPAVQVRQVPYQQSSSQMQPRQRRKRSEVRNAQTPMDMELDRQVNELMVSSYDAVAGKTSWQCAQCHFTSKVRSTVKEHIETHIEGFLHQCPYCVKTCKTRNALRVHVIRGHNKSSQMGQVQQLSPSNSSSPPKICYEPQSQPPQTQQQSNLQQQQSSQQNSSSSQQQSVLQTGSQQSSSQSSSSQLQQPNMVVVAKKTQVDPKLYSSQAEQQQQATKQSPSSSSSSSSTTSSSSIMNHPMIGRPMYGHPMMMGHPMI